jgi:hypothetical protein
MMVAGGCEDGAAMMFHVTLEQAEDGWYVAECPALPGCVAQGKDEADALHNVWLWALDKRAAAGLQADERRPTALVAIT